MTDDVSVPSAAATVDPAALAAKQQLLGGFLGGCVVASMIYLGDRLGLYAALAAAGAVTSEGFAAATGLHERWLREWLRGQAAAGLVDYDGAGRFSLSPEVALLLADDSGATFMAGAFQGQVNRMNNLQRLPESFRTGLGIAWDERGTEAVQAMERASAPWFRNVLVQTALPALDGVVARLHAGGEVADIGCGTGLALLEMARAFPAAQVHGYELSSNALARAEQNHAAAGVSNAHLHHLANESVPDDARFDLITTFDCMHDMTRPEDTAAAIRAAIKPNGCWFIADIDGQPDFEANLANNPAAAMMYGISVMGCLPSGMAQPGGAGLGTLGLPEPAMRALASAAGFTRFRRVAIAKNLNAFYEVRP